MSLKSLMTWLFVSPLQAGLLNDDLRNRLDAVDVQPHQLKFRTAAFLWRCARLDAALAKTVVIPCPKALSQLTDLQALLKSQQES